MTVSDLRTYINSLIKQNGIRAITGKILNTVLLLILDIIAQKKWHIYISGTYDEYELFHEHNIEITDILKADNVGVVQYSFDGATWTNFSSSLTIDITVNQTSRWRCIDFGSKTDGTIIIMGVEYD